MARRRAYTRKPLRRSRRRQSTRRSSFKRRSTFTRRRRSMSRRSVLNITSRKKRDTMIPSASNPDGTWSTGPLTLSAVTNPTFGVHIVPWLCTARNLIQPSAGTYGDVAQDAQRTASNCFMRGLAETIRITTNSNLPWEWRRICFTFRGNTFLVPDGTTEFYRLYHSVPDGISRALPNITPSSSVSGGFPGTLGLQMVRHLFAGTYGRDFADILTAKTDTNLIKVRYDKTIAITSANDVGTQRVVKRWHPMNGTLHYDDTESGSDKTTSSLSVESNMGMGDYYVVDIFKPHPSATTSDILAFAPQSTLYWHER
uniref:Capsid protein n=1 Tax=Finch associated genomovirus 5 TaxID=2576457 RepID=A0A4P8PT72_9VIRU|nr:capsid protein [Finch associated genomovirus 5]